MLVRGGHDVDLQYILSSFNVLDIFKYNIISSVNQGIIGENCIEHDLFTVRWGHPEGQAMTARN
jgi:hypothetical protein